ncbi:uncharacterized protein [Haliotis asinina]|uniref:uncharacterized protein n=1 Tax=Haliotis asinina TaxID=109174 RepID=UPI0035326925
MSATDMSGNSSSPAMMKEELKQKFCRLHQKAKELGLKDDDFNKIEALREISQRNKKKNVITLYLWKSFGLVFAVYVAICLVWCLEWPVKNDVMLSIYFRLQGLSEEDIYREPCVLEPLESMQDMFRPPLSCDFCKGIKQIDKVANIKPEEFEDIYAYSARPVVITDGMKNWTATEKFSFSFFKNIYKEGSPALENVENNCQFFPYKTSFKNLGEVFQMDEERATMKDGSQPWYIGWSNCDANAGNILRQHYNRPYFLPPVAESSKTDWVFMGSPGYGAHLHLDNVGHASWQAQVTGTKKWTLEPPVECYLDCEGTMEVTVRPGDIIVLDTNKWYHSTLNVGNDISITIGSEYD